MHDAIRQERRGEERRGEERRREEKRGKVMADCFSRMRTNERTNERTRMSCKNKRRQKRKSRGRCFVPGGGGSLFSVLAHQCLRRYPGC
jgi:hypothetical protein